MGSRTSAGFFWAAAILVSLLVIDFSQYPLLSNAQSTPSPAPAPGPSAAASARRALDVLLQDYAYRAFVSPRTGSVYTAQVPSNFSGITLSVVRLRSGSLRNRGLLYNEFNLPVGVVVTPYVLRLALVYQNLGNWSKAYYGIPDYTLVSPVIGLLAYNAKDLTATALPELGLTPTATGNPISVSMADLSSVRGSVPSMCVHFPVNGSSYRITGLVSGNLCMATEQGHFALVVNSSSIAPAPSPGPSSPPAPSPPRPGVVEEKKGESKVWKIVAAVVGGFLGLILLALLLLWMRRYKRKKTMTEMIKQSESGEVLKAQRVGNAQLPAAPMVRTRPALENDYVP